MKKLITILLLACSLQVQAQLELDEDYSFKRDKQYHAIAGAAISGTTFYLVYKKTNDESFAMRASIFAGVSAGFLKEFGDAAMGKELMLSDMLYTSVFSIGAGIILGRIIKYRKKRKTKELIEL